MRKEIDQLIATAMKNMKEILNIVKEKYPTANGGIVSKVVKENIK